MKLKHAPLLCAAALLPQIALADTALDSKTLGELQAVVDFCSRVDAGHGGFADQARRLLLSASGKDSKDSKDSASFQQGYQEIQGILSRIPGAQVVLICEAGSTKS